MNQRRELMALLFIRICTGLLIVDFMIPDISIAQIEGIQVGDYVKVQADSLNPSAKTTGTVSSLTTSNMELTTKDTSLIVLYSSIEKLQVRTGKRRNIGRGALIGGVVGALGFGIGSAISNKPCPQEGGFCFFETTDAEAFGLGAIVGLVLGGVVGGTAGIFIKSNRWKDLPVQMSAAIIPSERGGWALGPNLSWKF